MRHISTSFALAMLLAHPASAADVFRHAIQAPVLFGGTVPDNSENGPPLQATLDGIPVWAPSTPPAAPRRREWDTPCRTSGPGF